MGNLRSPETYLGHARAEQFASPGGQHSELNILPEVEPVHQKFESAPRGLQLPHLGVLEEEPHLLADRLAKVFGQQLNGRGTDVRSGLVAPHRIH